MAEFRKLSDVEHGFIEYDGSTTILIQNGGVIQQVPHSRLFTNIQEEKDILSDACAVVVNRSIGEPRLIPTTAFGGSGSGNGYDAVIVFTDPFPEEGQIFGNFFSGTFEDLNNKFLNHELPRIGVQYHMGDREQFLLPVWIEPSGLETLEAVRLLVLDGERAFSSKGTRYIRINIGSDYINAEVATQDPGLA